MKRTKHSLSHYKLATLDMGKLYPVGMFDVLPGDSIQQASSALIRVNPLATPVMHPVSVRIHHWFVPYRLLWQNDGTDGGWEEFITGGSDGEGDGAVFPTLTVTNGAVGSLADYLGLAVDGATDFTVSALPFRAYALIWNEYYRDQQLQNAIAIDKTGGTDSTTGTSLQSICWEKDYFTSARNDPQLGSEVTLPLGTSATVKTNATELFTGNNTVMTVRTTGNVAPNVNQEIGIGGTAGHVGYFNSAPGGSHQAGIYPTNLYADLSAATSVDVNTVRMAFALQRYQEARNMYGSRYTEYLRYLGVRSSDARLQRPEYLGGGKQTISFTEVLQTGTNFDANAGVASLKGHGIAAMRSRRYRRFFEEHGVVISLMSLRPKTMYGNGNNRMWYKTTKEDYWQKELEHVGMQEVYNREVYAADTGPADVFGYQDRYAEYRHLQSSVAGEFRDSTMNSWHLARIFASDVALNSDFVTCDPATRIYAATLTNHNIWCMINHSIQARRMVGRGNQPGRII